MKYEEFIERKTQAGAKGGFVARYLPPCLFDFQAEMTSWAVEQGRGAIFADTGLGKTIMELAWAQQVAEHTGKRILLLTPIAVGPQVVAEGARFAIACAQSRDGKLPSEQIVVTNYQQLHKFEPSDFGGVVCDESSILKHFSGATQMEVTRFMLKVPYRLLATATPAPNDFWELGTSSEALGYLGHSDMLTRFFRQSDSATSRMNDVKEARERKALGGNHFGKLAFRVSQAIGQWVMKAHAEVPFWRWVASWARACRKPSDVGKFDDSRFVLPELIERNYVVSPKRPADGALFVLPAFGLQEEREERRRTLDERCEKVAKLVDHEEQAIVWCHLNDEGDRLKQIIPDALQVSGADSDEAKEEAIKAFVSGQARVLVTKSSIFGFGLNLQNCAHVVTFATHSWESYYQSIRRCWRFGQKRSVRVDVISTEGEVHVRESMERKARAADQMWDRLVEHMRDATRLERPADGTNRMEAPAWA